MLLINVLQVLRLRRLLRCLPRLALMNSALVRLARAAPLGHLGAYRAPTKQRKHNMISHSVHAFERIAPRGAHAALPRS